MKTPHDHTFNPFKGSLFDWPSLLNRAFTPFWNTGAPVLDQPILPGWMFANEIHVTRQNSTSPETERDIVSKESYGKQIGRLMDAVMALIEERPEGSAARKPFSSLAEQHRRIEQIKARTKLRKIREIENELETLFKTEPDEYTRIATKMQSRLEDHAIP